MAIYMNKINRINAKERERERDESVTILYRSIVLDNTADNITNLTFKGSWESEHIFCIWLGHSGSGVANIIPLYQDCKLCVVLIVK
jgi:predicted ATPase